MYVTCIDNQLPLKHIRKHDCCKNVKSDIVKRKMNVKYSCINHQLKEGGYTSDLGVSVEADILCTFAAVDNLDVLEEVDWVESVAGRVEGDLPRPTLLQLGIQQGSVIKRKPLRYGLIYHNEGEISQFQEKERSLIYQICV